MTKAEELMDLLVQNKLITLSALEEIRKQPVFSADPAGAIIANGLVDIEELTKLKAKVYNFKYQSLLDVKIPDQVLKDYLF